MEVHVIIIIAVPAMERLSPIKYIAHIEVLHITSVDALYNSKNCEREQNIYLISYNVLNL
jgi:uncharacterized protein YlbG (UPF0298 family)